MTLAASEGQPLSSLPHAETSRVEAAISLRNIHKLFGRTAALRDVSADFFPGRLYLLLGGNGAGKSTLLRIITGLAKPTTGTVESRGRFGYMAHASMLYDELSGAENLRYFCRLYGTDERQAEPVMVRVGLDPALPRPVRDYSQGMRQRLSLARAIFHDPETVLLDEPFSNLDAAAGADVAALLRGLRDAGRCVVVVTHQPQTLAAAADQTLWMEAGRMAPNGGGRQ